MDLFRKQVFSYSYKTFIWARLFVWKLTDEENTILTTLIGAFPEEHGGPLLPERQRRRLRLRRHPKVDVRRTGSLDRSKFLARNPC